VNQLLSFIVRVRHEVAGRIVTLRCHQRFCPLYPIGTCVLGNEGVRSSRNNVSSLHGVVVNARADTTTASIRAVGTQDGVAWSTQVKRRATVVTKDKPKMLLKNGFVVSAAGRLQNQAWTKKVRGQVQGLRTPLTQMRHHRRRDAT
jgi:hypothetical protein